MRKLLVFFMMVLIVAGCQAPQIDEKERIRIRKLRTKVTDILIKLRTAYEDSVLTKQYKAELAEIGKIGMPEILDLATDGEQERGLVLVLLDTVFEIKDKKVCPFLIYLLDHDDELVRKKALYVLRGLSGKGFHFFEGWEPGNERTEAINRWLKWWLANKRVIGYYEYPIEWDEIEEIEKPEKSTPED